MKLHRKDTTPTYPKLSDAGHIFSNERPFGYFSLEGKMLFRRIKINKEITDSKCNTAHIIRDKYIKHGWLIKEIIENALKQDSYTHYQRALHCILQKHHIQEECRKILLFPTKTELSKTGYIFVI